ncbi:unnamed protein product [Lactuca virosa]|uniref:tRNA synthetases class I (E and Q) anti-codon binding domain-containing protein n=1 Tax=Lactuca virosa TaxID=75947 RepID=A0AAU9MZ46_9ASTR|nr:unnamed protein product [Lactuca virosa]
MVLLEELGLRLERLEYHVREELNKAASRRMVVLHPLKNPGELDKWLDDLNSNSKVVIPCAYVVPSLKHVEVDDKFQFERLGYFVADKDSTPENLIFNRTVTLCDSFGKAWK